MGVRVGIGLFTAQLPASSKRTFGQEYRETLELVRLAERVGFDSAWVSEHHGSSDGYLPSLLPMLAAFAAVTERVRLGTTVACVLHRSPAMLARVVADVDRISGGRVVLGIGAGWNEREFARFDIPFPPVAERLRAVPSTLRRVQREWRAEPFRDDQAVGKLLGGLGAPPVQRPRIPIMIGGRGERVTLRQVARYADMSNFDGPDADELRHKYAVLREHCDALGRPYDAVLRSVLRNATIVAPTTERVEEKVARLPESYRNVNRANVGTPEVLIERTRAVIAAGVQYVMFNLTTWDDVETLELLGRQVVPALQSAA
jgi:alkanesulfonate monooxygenase SsuD/methylene tetrahydromethanopterin reductase-like flavin-dependent oxidoreductase (luciferase family)